MAVAGCVSAMAGKINATPFRIATLVSKSIQRRRYSSKIADSIGHDFGFFFDIDGVLMRGKAVLPGARAALRLLTDTRGRFSLPAVFVTNSGNVMRHEKAQQLSQLLDVSISADQVVMSHSPLHMFRQFLDKHVLISGQGPVREIAQGLGFKHVSTIDTIRHAFPLLDNVDHKRRKAAPCAFERYFPKIDVILLLGEPVRWETNLQILIDMLLTNGQPNEAGARATPHVPDPHIPVLACNMDLMWMAESCMPRFGHGCFLHCLESLYQKITGHTLQYTALVGKPSELTYSYCEIILQAEARRLGLPLSKRIYCVGDNPESDIYGANLFDRYLSERRGQQSPALRRRRRRLQHADSANEDDDASDDTTAGEDEFLGSESCESILVCTGVYSSGGRGALPPTTTHSHRDFRYDDSLTTPTVTTQNVLEAVRGVFAKEGVAPPAL